MFDRIKYKNFAKQQLAGRYKVPVLMVLFIGIISWFIEIPINNSFKNIYEPLLSAGFDSLEDLSYYFSTTSGSTFLIQIMGIISSLLSFVFVISSLHVYIKMSRSPEPVHFSDFIEGFSAWSRGILCGLWQSLFIFLWSFLTFFLLCIPGVVKAYSYSQMFYIVEEFPEVSIRNAMKLSMKITKGHKGDLFLLDLSFFGWFLLSGLTMGIGSLYVTPYYEMTKVNAFHALLKEAVEKGIVSLDELKGEQKNAGPSESPYESSINTESKEEKASGINLEKNEEDSNE